MDLNDIKVGMKVKITKLESTKGFFIKNKHLEVRKENIIGTIKNYVCGHGGDVWWIEHDNGDVGAYCFTEFEELK